MFKHTLQVVVRVWISIRVILYCTRHFVPGVFPAYKAVQGRAMRFVGLGELFPGAFWNVACHVTTVLKVTLFLPNNLNRLLYSILTLEWKVFSSPAGITHEY